MIPPRGFSYIPPEDVERPVGKWRKPFSITLKMDFWSGLRFGSYERPVLFAVQWKGKVDEPLYLWEGCDIMRPIFLTEKRSDLLNEY